MPVSNNKTATAAICQYGIFLAGLAGGALKGSIDFRVYRLVQFQNQTIYL